MSVPLSTSKAQAIELLRRQIRGSQAHGDQRSYQPTGLATLDRLLPGGGIPVGAVMEWISETPGHAATSLAIRSAAALLQRPGCMAVIDEGRDFFPAIVPTLDVPLSRILLVQVPPGSRTHLGKTANPRGRARNQPPSSTADIHSEALWALEQTARCRGVRVVLGWLDRCTSAVVRRLQLAVEHSGVTIMLVRPATALKQPSFADLRLKVNALPFHTNPRQHHPHPPLPIETDSTRVSASTTPPENPPTRRIQVQLMRVRQGLQNEGIAELTQDWSERFSG